MPTRELTVNCTFQAGKLTRLLCHADWTGLSLVLTTLEHALLPYSILLSLSLCLSLYVRKKKKKWAHCCEDQSMTNYLSLHLCLYLFHSILWGLNGGVPGQARRWPCIRTWVQVTTQQLQGGHSRCSRRTVLAGLSLWFFMFYLSISLYFLSPCIKTHDPWEYEIIQAQSPTNNPDVKNK